jgi:hypothetical protein
MLGVALADDASHAVALDNLAVLTDRLHACANFHKTLRTNKKPCLRVPEWAAQNEKISRQTLTVTRTVT